MPALDLYSHPGLKSFTFSKAENRTLRERCRASMWGKVCSCMLKQKPTGGRILAELTADTSVVFYLHGTFWGGVLTWVNRQWTQKERRASFSREPRPDFTPRRWRHLPFSSLLLSFQELLRAAVVRDFIFYCSWSFKMSCNKTKSKIKFKSADLMVSSFYNLFLYEVCLCFSFNCHEI